MSEYVLISLIGRSDPIRSEHDGPMLHIIRWYHPRKVYMILSHEIASDEKEYHHNEEAIHLLDVNCQVKLIETGIQDVHSYDLLSTQFLAICNEVRTENPNAKILLNITSGTPQMQTAMCMIAIPNVLCYIPVQVPTPTGKSNRSSMFNPSTDLVEEWFETNLDNVNNRNRCIEPKLWNFRRPILQFQIESLINNYDYSGAFQLYQANQQEFAKEVGLLLDHGRKRVSLQNTEAKALAAKLHMEHLLYPVSQSNIARLVEFYNSMKIKQFCGELNDFSMRLEIMTEYLAIFILEKRMGISLDAITVSHKTKNSTILRMYREKCVAKIPGSDTYLDQQFSSTRTGGYEWEKPINSLTIVHLINYLSNQPSYQKYIPAIQEMWKWVDLTQEIRNPAAHTIIAITDDTFKKFYGRDSLALCNKMSQVLLQVFGSEVKKEGFEVYETLNDIVREALEKE